MQESESGEQTQQMTEKYITYNYDSITTGWKTWAIESGQSA